MIVGFYRFQNAFFFDFSPCLCPPSWKHALEQREEFGYEVDKSTYPGCHNITVFSHTICQLKRTEIQTYSSENTENSSLIQNISFISCLKNGKRKEKQFHKPLILRPLVFFAASSGNLHDSCVFGTYPDYFNSWNWYCMSVYISLFLSIGLPVGLIIYKPKYLSTNYIHWTYIC